MKRILFVFLLMIPFLSCSSDDSKGGGDDGKSKITAVLDGKKTVYDNVMVNSHVDSSNRVVLTVTALQGNDLENSINFKVYEGRVGEEAMWLFFELKRNGELYYGYSGFNDVITVSSNNQIKGYFSGIVSVSDFTEEEGIIEIKDGVIDITY